MSKSDIIVIGGGIAGLSVAAALSKRAHVVVLEQEDAIGFHSSGRSATYYHFGIGNKAVRGLTAYSRPFFETPDPNFCDRPLCANKPALFIAKVGMLEALANLYDEMCKFTHTVHRASESDMRSLLPVLKIGPDHIVEGVVDFGGRRLDADLLLQSFSKQLTLNGGRIETNAGVKSLRQRQGLWEAVTQKDQFEAPIIVNAAGAWADHIASVAGIRPLGLQPMRRTVITFDGPPNMDVRDWPFVKTAIDEFYMIPEGGRLLASPVDENPSDPVDAQPEEYDIALAAYRVEEYTNLSVRRVAHRWAGLRSFLPDRTPAIGFDQSADGFFWLAGQGGFGLQTSPAVAEIAAALIHGDKLPDGFGPLNITPDLFAPGRFDN